MGFDREDIKKLNEFTGFVAFKTNWSFRKFINLKNKTIFLDYGNQAGKTSSVAYSYVLRILGMHPIAEKNVLYLVCQSGHLSSPIQSFESKKCFHCGDPVMPHKRGSRTFRFASETLPGQSSNISKEGDRVVSAEVKNTIYPEFKKWLPPFIVLKDITARNASMTLKDIWGGNDIVVEFCSYGQDTQAMAGVQRVSIWMDESPNYEFYEEQKPRLLAEDGDLVITYTPVDHLSFLFSEIFDKAKVIYRSKVVCDFIKSKGVIVPQIEETGSPYDIAVVMSATDDNPTLNQEVIEKHFENTTDPDQLAIRRYGIFKHISGRIFKNFDYRTHFIPMKKYFPDEELPKDWAFSIGIDFHPQTPWAIPFCALSFDDEMFVWDELETNPEMLTCHEIITQVEKKGKDYKFRLRITDPLAEANKKDTRSTLEDMNRSTYLCKHDGIGFGGTWQTWDTKGEKGRDEIRKRLKNSMIVGRPFNNKVQKEGQPVQYLPTLWILDNCKLTAKSIHQWRWEEHSSSGALFTKEAKNKPEQKFSHFCTALEAILKEPAWKAPRRGPNMAPKMNYDRFRGDRINA